MICVFALLLLVSYFNWRNPRYNDYTMHPLFSQTREVILDILFPPICLTCGTRLPTQEKNNHICVSCLAAIAINTTLTCPLCGARMAEQKKTCHKDVPYRLAAATRYDDERVRRLIWELKYQKKTVASKPLASIATAHLASLPLNLSQFVIVPIPLHPSRERERGFNQSKLIAEIVASKFGLPIAVSALERNKHTKPQAETKDINARRENLAGAFAIKDAAAIAKKNILLVDDVFTSGATIGEAVKTLKSAGAQHIIALVVAKA